jgi:hypothetical protein
MVQKIEHMGIKIKYNKINMLYHLSLIRVQKFELFGV